MDLFGFDPWSLAGAAGSALLGLAGAGLGGWRGAALGFLAGAAAATFVWLKVEGWQEAARERDALRWQREALLIVNAANEAQHAVEVEALRLALRAVETVAQAWREAAARSAAFAAELRRRYEAQGYDPELSPAGQDYYDRKRQETRP